MNTRNTCSVLAIMLSLGLPAYAQDSAQQPVSTNQPDRENSTPAETANTLDVVYVTARRRTERLTDVPGSATALSADYLQQRGSPRTARDILAGEAGVRFFDTSSPVNSEVSIRGSSTARATNADPSVGLYRDGAYIGGGLIGGRSFARVDIFDAQRIEVLRGVQGALYGRNAVGGAVNLITTRPQFETGGYLDFKYTAEAEAVEGQAVANFAPSDSLAFRLGVDGVTQDDGLFYDRPNDVFFDDRDGGSVRAQMRYRNDRLDVTFLGEHQDLDVPGITYRVSIAPGGVFPVGYVQDPYEYPHSTAPTATQDITTGQINLEYDLGWASLYSTTMFRERTSDYVFDADGATPEILAQLFAEGVILVPLNGGSFGGAQDKTETFTEVAYLSGTAWQDRVEWLAGIEYLTQTSEGSDLGGTTNPVTGTVTGFRGPLVVDYDSYAVFGSLEVDVSDRLTATGELRYTDDERNVDASRFDFATGAQIGGDAFNFKADRTSDNVSYTGTLAYRFAPDWQVYGKAGTSYRAGGFNANLGVPEQPIPIPSSYDDETSTAYEAGLKGRVDKFYVAIAAYLSQSDDLIVQRDNGCGATVPECPVLSTSFLTNTGQAETWGVELEANSQFEIAGGDLAAAVSLSRQDGEVTAGPLEGLATAQTPEWIGSLNLSYSRRLTGSVNLISNAFYYGQSGGVQELTAATPDLDDYQLLNLRLGFQIANFEVAAFANNVFDEEYVIFKSATTERLGQPRTTGLELRYEF